MKIYFSCAMVGGRTDQPIYKQLVQHLLDCGCQVLTAHLADDHAMQSDRQLSPQAVFERDMAWVAQCDRLIAEVSTPSHGVGYEIAEALRLNKPVCCCYQAGRRVTKILLGNTHAKLQTHAYAGMEQAYAILDEFLT